MTRDASDRPTAEPTTNARKLAPRYVRSTIVMMLAALLGIAATNLSVDPFGVYGNAGDLAPYQAARHTRTWRAEALLDAKAHTVLIGSSRTEVGLDPKDAPADFGTVFNCGLSSAHSYEMLAFARGLPSNAGVRTLIVTAGPDTLYRAPGGTRDFGQCAFGPGHNELTYHLEKLLSYRSLKFSVATILAAQQSEPSIVRDDGFRDWALRPDEASPRERFVSVLARPDRDPESHLEADAWGAGRFDHIEQIAELCARRGWRFVYVIPPTHAARMVKWHERGKLDRFSWLRRTAAVRLHDVFERAGRPGDLLVIDFSAPSPPLMEAIPEPGGGETRFWWEELHFKPALGAMMFERIGGVLDAVEDQGDGGNDVGGRGDSSGGVFGVVLTPGNVDAHDLAARVAFDTWLEENPDTAAWVRSQLAE